MKHEKFPRTLLVLAWLSVATFFAWEIYWITDLAQRCSL